MSSQAGNLIGHVFPLRILKGHASSRAVFLFTYSPNIALQNVFALNAYMVIEVGVNRRKLIKKYGRFTTRTEELTKCCEPLQKLRVRLGTCKTGLSPPVTLCY